MLAFFRLFFRCKPDRRRRLKRASRSACSAEKLESRVLLTSWFVATDGNDNAAGSSGQPFATIQHALDEAKEAGDTITVRDGVYHEKIEFRHSGNRNGGFITLRAASDHVVLDGAGVNNGRSDMVRIENLSYVRIIGFEILNNLDASDGSGIRIIGSGSHIQVRNNTIHKMRGISAMGITVYGTQRRALSGIVISGNEIYDSEPAPSEALTLNGNVSHFKVLNNTIHDVNNIGIDMIGGESDIQPDNRRVARYGVVRGNEVYRIRSTYEDGFAAAIYIDGGHNIVVRDNNVYQSDMGIEIGAENRGIQTHHITVRDNNIHDNDKAGLAIGGYARTTGRVVGARVYGNTIRNNDTLDTGFGQVWLQYARNTSIIRNDIIAATNGVLINTEHGALRTRLHKNRYFFSDGADNALFYWRGRETVGFDAWERVSKQDKYSVFADSALLDTLLHSL